MLKECGLPSSTFRNITQGAKPSYDKIAVIADYFDVSGDYLLGRVDDPHGEIVVALSTPKGYDKLTDEEKNFINAMIEKYTKDR